MKKIITILLLLIVTLPVFAANTQMKLELGVQNTDISLNYKGNTGNVKFNAKTDLNLTVVFDGKNGFNLVFAPDLTGNSFVVGGGYVLQTKVGNSTKLLVSAGPRINVKSSTWSLGADVSASLHLDLTSKMYLAISTGTEIYLAEFRNGETKAYLDLTIPLPRIAIGYTF